MASTGSVYIYDSIRGKKGNVLVVGRAKFGNNATLEARDFGLTRIYGAQFTPYGNIKRPVGPGSIGSLAAINYARSFESVNGSIGSLGSLNSYVKVRALVVRTLGSITISLAVGSTGLYIGTKAGSINSNFQAWGR